MNLDEALDMVEAAGYTVTDDRRLVDHYQRQEKIFRTLLKRATKGDWTAAEYLIKRIRGYTTHLPYSPSLSEFVDLLMCRILSERGITTQRKPGKRIKYPILTAMLGDARTNYTYRNRVRHLQESIQSYRRELDPKYLEVLLGERKYGDTQYRDLVAWVAKHEGFKSVEINKLIDLLSEAKRNPEIME